MPEQARIVRDVFIYPLRCQREAPGPVVVTYAADRDPHASPRVQYVRHHPAGDRAFGPCPFPGERIFRPDDAPHIRIRAVGSAVGMEVVNFHDDRRRDNGIFGDFPVSGGHFLPSALPVEGIQLFFRDLAVYQDGLCVFIDFPGTSGRPPGLA